MPIVGGGKLMMSECSIEEEVNKNRTNKQGKIMPNFHHLLSFPGALGKPMGMSI